jgi:pyrimidine operon attenuation protein/uracil phosphoribosyltransferase
MLSSETRILTASQVRQKIKRMAFQLYENNFEEKQLILAGISPNGYVLAELLAAELRQIATIDVVLLALHLDKSHTTQSHVAVKGATVGFQQQCVVVVDDVVNSGKTLIYSLQPFLQQPVKKLQTAVLVQREYRNFPIHTDYVGYALSTTIKQHVQVELQDSEKFGVYLY